MTAHLYLKQVPLPGTNAHAVHGFHDPECHSLAGRWMANNNRKPKRNCKTVEFGGDRVRVTWVDE